jgi:hypothetical protein
MVWAADCRGWVDSGDSRTGSGSRSGWEVTPLGKILFVCLGPALVLVAVHFWLGSSHRNRVSSPVAVSAPQAPLAPMRQRIGTSQRVVRHVAEGPVAFAPAAPTLPHANADQTRHAPHAPVAARRPKLKPRPEHSQPPDKAGGPPPTPPPPTPPTPPTSAPVQTKPVAAPTPAKTPGRSPLAEDGLAARPLPTNLPRAKQPRWLRKRPIPPARTMPPARAAGPTAPPAPTAPPSSPAPASASDPTHPNAWNTGSGHTATPSNPPPSPHQPKAQARNPATR